MLLLRLSLSSPAQSTRTDRLGIRRRALAAAESLFIRAGNAATTMTAVAGAANVAVQAVYAVFSTKRVILAQLLAVRTVADGPRIL